MGGMRGRGACMVGGSVWQGGMHGKGGVCGRGHVWQGGMCGKGACVAGGVHGRGACVAGGMCAWQGRGHAWWVACVVEGGMCGRYYEIRSMSGRYASYWNAFLFSSTGLERIPLLPWLIRLLPRRQDDKFQVLSYWTAGCCNCCRNHLRVPF